MLRYLLNAYERWLLERAQKKTAERIGQRVLRDSDHDHLFDYHWRPYA